jgi:O-acetyl-ADP-ribose deacetylase (regulator of RNase III)
MHYRKSIKQNGLALGSVDLVRVESDSWVANMMAQKGLRSRSNPIPLRLYALAECLATLKMKTTGRSVHMPRIGCGLAGGTWSNVEPIIARELAGVDVYVYDLKIGRSEQ